MRRCCCVWQCNASVVNGSVPVMLRLMSNSFAGALAKAGGEPGNKLLQLDAPGQLLAALKAVRTSPDVVEGENQGHLRPAFRGSGSTQDNSAMPEGVRQGAYRCLLSAVVVATQDAAFKAALNEASAANRLQVCISVDGDEPL